MPRSRRRAASAWRSLFGDRLYVELQRHGIDRERRVEAGLIDLAYAKGLPLVATNEPYFATTDDYEAHDALLCIAGGRLIAETDRDQLTPDHRFKTRAEMAVLFADMPEALASTVEIAERCSFRPTDAQADSAALHGGAGANAADAASDEAAELRRQAEEGLASGSKVHGLSQGTTEEDYRRAARLRARRHHPHELCGLLPDRRRLHQMGEGRRAFRSDRAAARARARWSPMR